MKTIASIRLFAQPDIFLLKKMKASIKPSACTLITALLFSHALSAEPVITAGISFDEFEAAFNGENRVWYAQLQPGSSGRRGSNIHEFEIGGSTGTFDSNDPYYKGDFGEGVIWDLDSNNPFTITVDSANNLSVTAASFTTPNGNEYPITKPFNEIWVGLRIITGDELDNISVNSHRYDGKSINDLTIVDASVNDFAAFKFYDDQETDNIAEFTIDGELLLELIGNRAREEWTYTIFGVYNPDLESTPTIPVRMTSFNYDSSADTVSFTWDSNASATYSIHYTEDLATPFDNLLQSDIASGGASTGYGPVASPVPDADKLFFKLTETLP